MTVRKAVILAAGRGTRMQQRTDDGTALTAEQERAAAAGAKALMPVGRPFLDYVLSALADAGIEEVCLVVAPAAPAIRDRYTRDVKPVRLRVSFAEQREPCGTADALLAARAFTGDDAFLVLNADNYYPIEALRAMTACDGCAVAAFGVEALVSEGNIPRERIQDYAVLSVTSDGWLHDIVEKPSPRSTPSDPPISLVSLNLWTFTLHIFAACERIPRSVRGEHELPDAVRLAVREQGVRVRALRFDLGALDLSRRADVASVAARLGDVVVRL